MASDSYVTPEDDDVLCGRSNQCNIHPGNVKYKEIIAEYFPQYIDAGFSKWKKSDVVEKAFQKVTGRFLKKDMTGKWHAVGKRAARDKIGHAFRGEGRLQMTKKTAPQNVSAAAIRTHNNNTKENKSSKRAASPKPKSMQDDSAAIPTQTEGAVQVAAPIGGGSEVETNQNVQPQAARSSSEFPTAIGSLSIPAVGSTLNAAMALNRAFVTPPSALLPTLAAAEIEAATILALTQAASARAGALFPLPTTTTLAAARTVDTPLLTQIFVAGINALNQQQQQQQQAASQQHHLSPSDRALVRVLHQQLAATSISPNILGGVSVLEYCRAQFMKQFSNVG